jgi:hypothetical protein
MNTRGHEGRMSARMRDQIVSNKDLYAEMLFAHDKAMCAHQAMFLDAEDATVGARNVMGELRDYWLVRRDAAKNLIDDRDPVVGADLLAICQGIGCSAPRMVGFAITPEQYAKWLEYNDQMAKEGMA